MVVGGGEGAQWGGPVVAVRALASEPEKVFQGIQRHHDDFGVGTAHQIAEWRDYALLDEVAQLLLRPPGNSIGDRPSRLRECRWVNIEVGVWGHDAHDGKQ